MNNWRGGQNDSSVNERSDSSLSRHTWRCLPPRPSRTPRQRRPRQAKPKRRPRQQPWLRRLWTKPRLKRPQPRRKRPSTRSKRSRRATKPHSRRRTTWLLVTTLAPSKMVWRGMAAVARAYHLHPFSFTLGTIFDSNEQSFGSRKVKGKVPLKFKVGVGRVIKGVRALETAFYCMF